MDDSNFETILRTSDAALVRMILPLLDGEGTDAGFYEY